MPIALADMSASKFLKGTNKYSNNSEKIPRYIEYVVGHFDEDNSLKGTMLLAGSFYNI